MLIASCTINNLCFVSVVEAFASWHTVELTGIWCFVVRHPVIGDTLEWRPIEMGTLLLSKVRLVFTTVLCVTREVFLASALTERSTLSNPQAFPRLICNTSTARSRALGRRAPRSPLGLISIATRNNI